MMTDSQPASSAKRGRFRFLAVAAAALGLIFLELIARYGVGLGDPPLLVADPEIEYLFVPGSYTRFGNQIHYNRFSMRSPELSSEKSDGQELRVLMLGDSVLNGGALTDDRDLATSILARRLSDSLGRSVFVGNVSAASWGPTNQAAYLRKYGWFDADVVVMVESAHDAFDASTFEAVVGVSPKYPASRPPLALVDGLQRYAMPYLASLWSPRRAARPVSRPGTERKIALDATTAALRYVFDEGRKRGVPVVLLLFWSSRDIASSKPVRGVDLLRETANRSCVPIIDMKDVLAAALAKGEPVYRDGDPIHPTQAGQRLIADAIELVLREHLGARIGTAGAQAMAPPCSYRSDDGAAAHGQE